MHACVVVGCNLTVPVSRLSVVRRAAVAGFFVGALVLAGCTSSQIASRTVVTPARAYDPGKHSAAAEADRSHRRIIGGGKLESLADVSATPHGWSPVAYRTGQVSVPSNWYVELPGGNACGQDDPGRVFIARAARLPTGVGCGPAANVVTIRQASSAPLPHAHPQKVHGIRVELSSSRRGKRTIYHERGLGLDITATGPFARQIVRTFTHSPLSAVANSTGLLAPRSWRRIDFGGLRFDVPPLWRTEQRAWWGGCPANLTPHLLVLSTARILSAPGCPASLDTVGINAGEPGMIVGAGPKIGDGHVPGETCRPHNGLRVCIDPPPLRGGEPTDNGLQILAASVYLPNRQRPDHIEIGLFGSGLTSARIFDSTRAAR